MLNFLKNQTVILRNNANVLIFCWLFLLLVKIYATTFAINMKNPFQDIAENQFQRQLKVPSHKQSSLCTKYMDEKYFRQSHICFCGTNPIDNF